MAHYKLVLFRGFFMIKDIRLNRKSITFNELILEVVEEEINRRGGQTSYSALVNEVLAERFAKQLEQKINQAKIKN